MVCHFPVGLSNGNLKIVLAYFLLIRWTFLKRAAGFLLQVNLGSFQQIESMSKENGLLGVHWLLLVMAIWYIWKEKSWTAVVRFTKALLVSRYVFQQNRCSWSGGGMSYKERLYSLLIGRLPSSPVGIG